MIKCFFVDVNSISSDLPRSSFTEADLEKLADFILATDGLLRPLILTASGVEKYTVLDGHREYYAVVKAKEKNSTKAEMVNAFVVGANIQQSAIEQLGLLTEAKLLTPAPLSESIHAIIEQLLPPLLTMLSEQIQPLVDRLAVQKQLLDTLVTLVNNPTTASRKHEDESILPPPIPIITDPKLSKKEEVEQAEIIQPDLPAETKSILSKEANTLNLINTLDLDPLTLKMKHSKISNAEKLAVNIIDTRNNQPQQKFDTWEIVTAKVKGLGAKTIQKIIDKLK